MRHSAGESEPDGVSEEVSEGNVGKKSSIFGWRRSDDKDFFSLLGRCDISDSSVKWNEMRNERRAPV